MKIGLIGCGHQGRKFLHAIALINGVRLSAICDPYRAFSESRYYRSHKEMLSEESIDCAIVVVPHHEYAPIIHDLAKANIHILKEKPFARTIKEACDFQSLADDAQILLRTYPQRRFSSLDAKLQEWVSQIGELFFIDIHYTLSVNDPHVGWRGDRLMAGGGCLIDMGYHMVDILIRHFGLPDFVFADCSARAIAVADYDAEDTMNALFSYKNGLHGSLLLSRVFPPKSEKITVLGQKGMVVLGKDEIQKLSPQGELLESFKPLDQELLADQVLHFTQEIQARSTDKDEEHFRTHLSILGFITACYEAKQSGTTKSPQEFIFKENRQLCLN